MRVKGGNLVSSRDLHRRQFLAGTGSATLPLIGTGLAAAPFQATSVAANKGAPNPLVNSTHEFSGFIDERLNSPLTGRSM